MHRRLVIFTFVMFTVFSLFAINPVLAADVTIEQWATTLSLQENGSADIIIQAGITPNTAPMTALSIEVPSEDITLLYDFEHTTSFLGFTATKKVKDGGTEVTLHFNQSIEPGKTWNGRIGFLARGVAERTTSDYTLDYPLKPPVVTTTSGAATVRVEEDALRVQSMLPEGYDIVNITPRPFRNIFQDNHISSAWTSRDIKMGDTLHITAEYSELLAQIVEVNKQIAQMKTRVKAAGRQGVNVTAAEEHITLAEEYITAQALVEYYKGKVKEAEEFISAAQQELTLAEQALATTPEATSTAEAPVSEKKQTPSVGVITVMAVLALLGARLRRGV